MPLDVVGLEGLAEDTFIPGVAVFSRRSVPLAAWTRFVLLYPLTTHVPLYCQGLSPLVDSDSLL